MAPAAIGTYLVTFYNGQQAEAKVAYYDIWQDYAILKVDPSELPKTSEQIIFSSSEVKQEQSVFVVGNTEAQDFSFHTGYLSNLYEINGDMPQSSYIVNLNSAGGASGSPLLDEKCDAIGVIYGGGKTFAIALKGQYVIDALKKLKENNIPTRKHIGVLCELYSLNKAVKHRHFPKEKMEEYLEKHPDSRNRVLSVKSVLAGAPAANVITSGDIIWEVDGKPVRGNLIIFDEAMNNATSNTINLVIYRDGKKIEQTVELYDINKNKITRIVDFAGASFF